jgi:hypothetical protein
VRRDVIVELEQQLEQVMEDDREFFQQHPDQDSYLRPIMPVEIAEAQAMGKVVTAENWMLVGLLDVGMRCRLLVPKGVAPPIAEFDNKNQVCELSADDAQPDANDFDSRFE